MHASDRGGRSFSGRGKFTQEEKLKTVYRIGTIIMLLSLVVSCAIPSLERRQASGVYHRVKKGETLYSIAQAYKISLQYLAEVNYIENSKVIEAGQILFIPEAQEIVDAEPLTLTTVEEEKRPEKKSEPPRIKPTVQDNARDKDAGERKQKKTPTVKSGAPPVKKKAKILSEKSSEGSPKREITKASPPVKSAAPPAREKAKVLAEKSPKESPAGKKTTIFPKTLSKKDDEPLPGRDDNAGEDGKNIVLDKKLFIWPVTGRVVSRYGAQPNGMFFNGIKIVTKESSVIAAADGTVILSSLLKDFGETIFMKHDDNYVTVYTNLGQRLVKVDDHVKKGSVIATLAKSDDAGEASMYFEVRYMNKARNPLFFLP